VPVPSPLLLPLIALGLLSGSCADGELSLVESIPCTVTAAPRPPGLILAGSGSNLPLVRLIADRYLQAYPGAQLTIPPSIGTGGAVRALLDGAIDVGLASRALRPNEKARGLVETPLAHTRLVLAAHPSTVATRVTWTEILAIYRGERQSWPDGRRLAPLLREPGDSGRQVLRVWLPELEHAMEAALRASRFRVCYTDSEMQNALLSIPGALGFLDEGALRLDATDLRVVQLIGAPEPDSSPRNSKPLTLVTRGRPRGEAARFIELATSAAVETLLQRGGYTR